MIQARPSKIGKYEVESVVGEGAMGVVYCAMDSMLNRRVAIKVMSDAIAQDKDLRERFLREAQAAGSLQHPNVVTIYDFGEVDGHLYIAMEYVEGEDLEDLLGSKIQLPLDAKLELIIGVLHGLAFAHKRGVVHRDIKPANIRVDQEGKARIMDFGVAHLASSDMTRTGMMLGTPSYMAPEQILGGQVSPATDIFSVGAVLYELLTNTRPFRGDTLQTLMYQILSTMPRPVTELVPGLPPELDRIVMRSLQKESKDRYAHALEMANDLTMVKPAKGHDGTATSMSLRATIDTALAQRQSGAREVARRRQTTRTVATVIGAAVLLALGYGASRLDRDSAPVPAPLVSNSAAGTIAEPQTPRAPAADASPPSPSAIAAPSTTADVPASAPRKPSSPAAPAGPTPQEIALARSVQRSALDGRSRAVTAGATADQLRSGDTQNTSGETLLGRGRTLDAADAFNRAAASWMTAERTARDQAAARTVAETSSPLATGAPATPPAGRVAEQQPIVVPVAPPPSLSPNAQGSSAASPRAPANPRPEIESVIGAYARAIESRNIAELRRIYPTMSADQRRAFEDFFRSTRSLRAALAVTDLQVDGATAEARLAGTYEYITTAGTTERQPVSFRATLQNDAGAWKLVAVR